MNIVSTTEEIAPGYIPAKYDIHKMLLIDLKSEDDKQHFEALMKKVNAQYGSYEEYDEDDIPSPLFLKILVQKKTDIPAFRKLAEQLHADCITEAEEDAVMRKMLNLDRSKTNFDSV